MLKLGDFVIAVWDLNCREDSKRHAHLGKYSPLAHNTWLLKMASEQPFILDVSECWIITACSLQGKGTGSARTELLPQRHPEEQAQAQPGPSYCHSDTQKNRHIHHSLRQKVPMLLRSMEFFYGASRATLVQHESGATMKKKPP